MNDLKENLFLKPTRETRRKVFVLHGLGGFGKTQLAIEFAQRSQKIFSSIFWLNGDSKKNVRQSLAQIGRKLLKDQVSDLCRRFFKTFPEELDEIIRNILIWFDQLENNRWLLIFDNVDRDNSPEADDSQSYDVEEFFSEVNHGSILITSRLRQLRQHRQDR
jgi:ATP/maltotriose-dependent transcriptional regulator MalT